MSDTTADFTRSRTSEVTFGLRTAALTGMTAPTEAVEMGLASVFDETLNSHPTCTSRLRDAD